MQTKQAKLYKQSMQKINSDPNPRKKKNYHDIETIKNEKRWKKKRKEKKIELWVKQNYGIPNLEKT